VAPVGDSPAAVIPFPPQRPASQSGLRTLALLGNPNTGKTTLFNRLCGTRAKTSNFPGTTTSIRTGRTVLPDETPIDVVDLPGLYELNLEVPESGLCRDVLLGLGVYRRPDVVVVVADACNLTRNLVLVAELVATGRPVVVALNMVDLAQRRGLSLDATKLEALLGCDVVPMVARKGLGVDELRERVAVAMKSGGRRQDDVRTPPRAAALLPPPPADSSIDVLMFWADQVVEQSVGGAGAIGTDTDTLTERLDAAFTHPVLGVVVFTTVMGGLFWTLFTLAAIPMDLIEATFASLGRVVGHLLPPGPVHDMVAEGIIGGIAGTVVFLPQICLLFFLISLLEDTGYLARAAFVMDRLLCRFGLPGHAFVPLLTSHACALPGLMATRLIPDPRDRLVTILVSPMMSCSARLPVYVLLTSLLFADRPLLAGLAFAGCYTLGAAAALGSAMLFGRSILRGRARPMVLELPSYKMPSLTNAFLTAREQGWAFLRTAGTVIMAICVVMWWLSAFPSTAPPPHAERLRSEAAAPGLSPQEAETLTAQADALVAQHRQANSYAAMLGRVVQPLFAPLGYDWQLSMGVLTSFLAREVFVSTMSVLIGASTDAPADEGVIQRIRGAVRDNGKTLLTPATTASVLVFFVLAMQCLPTLTVTRRETGSIKWAALQLGYMTTLAYVFAFVTYQGMRMAGWS
jgi:ferrous iron transport protein B